MNALMKRKGRLSAFTVYYKFRRKSAIQPSCFKQAKFILVEMCMSIHLQYLSNLDGCRQLKFPL